MNHQSLTKQSEQALRLERLWASGMSLICSLLLLLALVAAIRIPDYLAAPDYLRLIGTIFFTLLVLAGLGLNLYHHRCLRRLAASQSYQIGTIKQKPRDEISSPLFQGTHDEPTIFNPSRSLSHQGQPDDHHAAASGGLYPG